MNQLSYPALEAILREWDPTVYDPPHTDIVGWTHTIESLCDTYGIPDTQRAQCAAKFVKDELCVKLEKVLGDARATFGPTHWDQFKIFMTEFDRDFREKWDKLPFYKKHPKSTKIAGVALGLTGGVLLAPLAAAGLLTAVGFTSAGVAAGSIAASIQSIVYGGATGGLFSLLQSAGATMVLPSVGTVLTGVATTGVGIAAVTSESATIDVADSFTRSHHSSKGSPHQTASQEYLLTPRAIQAIVKSWSIAPYNPPGTNAADWLASVRDLCEVYEVPVTQRARCSMYLMRDDCRKAADAARCHDMTWDQFTAWLLKYDGANRMSGEESQA